MAGSGAGAGRNHGNNDDESKVYMTCCGMRLPLGPRMWPLLPVGLISAGISRRIGLHI